MPQIKINRKEQAKVDAWNAAHAVGTYVTLHKDGGEVIATRTLSRAEVLSGHTAVIWLEGVSGCYDLTRVTALPEKTPASQGGALCIGCGARNVEAAAHAC